MVRRRISDVGRFSISAAVLGLSMALASQSTVASWEVDLFRAFNDLPGFLYWVIWPLMQYGTFFTIPVLMAVALLFRRVRLAMVLGVSGVGVYLLAKVVKEIVSRGRPGALLSDVHLRGVEALGLGFPSGHAAVAAALATAASAYLTKRWHRIGVALAIVVPIGRMYVGAHLPLDVVGGAALGVLIASTVHLVAGVPVRKPGPKVARLSGQDVPSTTQ